MTLLRLLADDAPSADVTRAAEQLAADDPVAGATARDLAERVRSMDASKRREAELSALVDVARELASVRTRAACWTRSCTAPAPWSAPTSPT